MLNYFLRNDYNNDFSSTFVIARISSAPTAADVSVEGQVVTADGRGIRNARVTLLMADGTVRSTLTSSFGYYRFEDIPAGQTLVLAVSAKRFRFANPTLVLNAVDSLANVDFVANE